MLLVAASRIAWCTVFFLVSSATVAVAVEPVFPALTGRVVDEAAVLSPEAESRLADELAAHERATGDQVVVATVQSLQGLSVEEFGNRLFRAWQLGTKANNGALLLVAPNERKVRIEVGYGLEDRLTDATASVIIQSLVLPRFRAGDLSGGVEAGARGILELLRPDQGAPSSGWAEQQQPSGTSVPWPMLVIFAFFAVLLLLRLLQDRRFRGPQKLDSAPRRAWLSTRHHSPGRLRRRLR